MPEPQVPPTTPLDRIAPPPPRRGRRRRKAIAAEDLVGRDQVALLERYLDRYRNAYTHPNRKLHYDDVVVGMLFGFYNPLARSTRMIELLSQIRPLSVDLSVDRICRSTFSDALQVFDPHLLLPLVQELRARVPDLSRRDADLNAVVKKIIAADGSFFTVASDAAFALPHTKSDGKKQGRVRLNLQLEVLGGVPEALSVSGQGEGSETAAVAKLLKQDVIYLVDRNFVDFEFIKAVLGRGPGAPGVLRLQSSKPNFQAERELPLSDKDREHRVLSDRIGRLPGSAGSEPPDATLRELVLEDPKTGQKIRVLTSLLDLQATAIPALYRYRWQVEVCHPYCLHCHTFDEPFGQGLGRVRSAA